MLSLLRSARHVSLQHTLPAASSFSYPEAPLSQIQARPEPSASGNRFSRGYETSDPPLPQQHCTPYSVFAPHPYTMPPKPHLNILSARQTFPPVLILPARSTGNNVPKSLHKTRRTWQPNVHRMDQVVRVLETAHTDKRTGQGVLKGVKMRIHDLRSYRKAGGLEGCLVGGAGGCGDALLPLTAQRGPRQLSRPSKHFTDFGKQLRADLFKRLIALRDAEKLQQATASPPANEAAPSTTAA